MFCLWFLRGVLMVSCLMSQCLNQFEFCASWGSIFKRGWFTFSCQTFQHHLLKRRPFPILYDSFLCWIWIDCRCLGLFLGSLCCSIDPFVWFVPIPCCFDYCSFAVLYEVLEGYASCSVPVLQDCFGNYRSYGFI